MYEVKRVGVEFTWLEVILCMYVQVNGGAEGGKMFFNHFFVYCKTVEKSLW